MDHKGFTLVELAIVLVIIGLIVGGVLVGQDMIHAAEVRGSIKQIEAFKAATGTFRTKYNCLPGDCARATSFGFANNGDGNGTIVSDAGASESTYYWQHLSGAGLIEGSYNGNMLVPGDSPEAKLGGTFYLGAESNPGPRNYITFIAFIASPPPICNGDECSSLTPAEAQSIDQKLDDGLPTTGAVRTFGDFTDFLGNNTPSEGAIGASSDFCVGNDVTPFAYNVQNTNVLCTLSVALGY